MGLFGATVDRQRRASCRASGGRAISGASDIFSPQRPAPSGHGHAVGREPPAATTTGVTTIERRLSDPYHHPVTIHSTSPASSRDQVEDAAVLDLDMLQTGHGDRDSLGPTVRCVTRAYAGVPPMPVVNREVCYEGIVAASREEIQRLMFWACLLSGAAGHTYGANGIWQVNSEEHPYGPSPHGFSWGDTPWQEAMRLPGSAQVALGKRLLERYPWWRFTPHPDWCSMHAGPENFFRPYAAGVAGEVRILYFPRETAFMWRSAGFAVQHLEADLPYRAYFVNPATGQE